MRSSHLKISPRKINTGRPFAFIFHWAWFFVWSYLLSSEGKMWENYPQGECFQPVCIHLMVLLHNDGPPDYAAFLPICTIQNVYTLLLAYICWNVYNAVVTTSALELSSPQIALTVNTNSEFPTVNHHVIVMTTHAFAFYVGVISSLASVERRTVAN